jgi:hypothetical protein
MDYLTAHANEIIFTCLTLLCAMACIAAYQDRDPKP